LGLVLKDNLKLFYGFVTDLDVGLTFLKTLEKVFCSSD
jgi:hypothetical protein